MNTKKFIFFGMLAALLLCSACRKEKENNVKTPSVTSNYIADTQTINDDEEEDEEVEGIDISLEESLELKKKIDAQGTKVTVHNALEFLMAIGDGRTIIVDSKDTIYLSPAIVGLKNNGYCKNQGITVLDYGFKDQDNKGIFLYDNYDGLGVAICGINNLTITSRKGAVIVSSPRYDDVLKFVKCQNLKLSNLVLGHTFEGYCEDGVLSFIKSSSITVDNCDLYGCGTEGLIIDETENLNCNNVIIRDCSYYIMHINKSRKIHFNECNFHDNRQFEQINVSDNCSDIIFYKCNIASNQGTLFNVNSDIVLRKCIISHDDVIGENKHVKFENTTLNR